MKKFVVNAWVVGMVCICFSGLGQKQPWVDSVLKTLSNQEKIAQLMVMRASGRDTNGNTVLYYTNILNDVKKYNIGAICLFQGKPEQHADLINQMNRVAKTPVMVTVDAEWGLGMRFAGVKNFPYQITLGALPDANLVYEVGAQIAAQCRRMNIHVNYAPVVDINNNAKNPVIGFRSFGENKFKVALLGTRIMQGMQDNGVMACAKHFPGHGDVAVDSHFDLPLIQKPLEALNDLELYPFKELFAKGIGSTMIAHLYIPAIDSTQNLATSLSSNTINGLLRQSLGYQGLTFTDGLEMRGVTKFFPDGEAAVQSLIAGNDMLCLPGSVPVVQAAVQKAIEEGKLSWQQIENKCRRVLEAKYDYVMGKTKPINTKNLTRDLNSSIPSLRRKVAVNALTVVQGSAAQPAFKLSSKTGYLAVGAKATNATVAELKRRGIKIFYLPLKEASDSLIADLKKDLQNQQIKTLWIGIHGMSNAASNRYGISKQMASLVNEVAAGYQKTSLLIFGNPYSLAFFDSALYQQKIICYEDDAIFQKTGADWLLGNFSAVGKLPVSVGEFVQGTGMETKPDIRRPSVSLLELGLDSTKLLHIDTIAKEAVDKMASPGCVVTVVKGGVIAYQKAFGYFDSEKTRPVDVDVIYDLASVTKTSATTLAIMRLYELGLIKLQDSISTYLPWLKGSDKQAFTIENLLMHQAGMVPFIPFYKEVINSNGSPNTSVFSNTQSDEFSVDITDMLFMRKAWQDTMLQQIKRSPITTGQLQYVYSDNDFILLGQIVEAITGQSLRDYVKSQFFDPLGLTSTDFRIFERFPKSRVAPTEREKIFRQDLIWGYVHDPGAAMFGNIAGHAGLFSNATDLAVLYQMLLNGGKYGGKKYFNKQTIEHFTSYQTPISRRGLGFDKPEKNNDLLDFESCYPARFISSKGYGHTGFTGTCVWVDPVHDLVYIFLSNRIHPDVSRKLIDLNIRGRIQDAVYESILF